MRKPTFLSAWLLCRAVSEPVSSSSALISRPILQAAAAATTTTVHCESKKRHSPVANNIAKCRSIFKILSPIDSVVNSQ